MNEKFLNHLIDERKKLDSLIAAIAELPELEKIAGLIPFTPNSAIVSMSYDLKAFAVNRDRLLAAGWDWNHDMSIYAHCGEIMPEFWKDGVRLHFQVDPDIAGSTCKKRVIGHESHPVYEVVCAGLEE
jgi:hypothetical protein